LNVILIGGPYIRRHDDMLHIIAQVELFLLILAGHFLFTSQRYGLDYATDLAMSIIMVMVIISLVLFFVIRSFLLARHLWWGHQRRKLKRLMERQDLEEKNVTPTPTTEGEHSELELMESKHANVGQQEHDEKDGSIVPHHLQKQPSRVNLAELAAADMEEVPMGEGNWNTDDLDADLETFEVPEQEDDL